ESFEANRFQPVTVPILIDRSTFFVVASAVGPLRRKGRLTARQKEQRAAHEVRFGRRRSSSDRVVRQVLERLRRRSWCVSKRREALAGHLDIAALWINYARGITNRTAITPAQAL